MKTYLIYFSFYKNPILKCLKCGGSYVEMKKKKKEQKKEGALGWRSISSDHRAHQIKLWGAPDIIWLTTTTREPRRGQRKSHEELFLTILHVIFIELWALCPTTEAVAGHAVASIRISSILPTQPGQDPPPKKAEVVGIYLWSTRRNLPVKHPIGVGNMWKRPTLELTAGQLTPFQTKSGS